MRYFLLFILQGALLSCNGFDSNRKTEASFYEEEIRTIDWAQVDTYPEFSACETLTDRAQHRACFEKNIAQQVNHSISSRGLKAVKMVHDTVWVHFLINERAAIEITQIKVDSVLQSEFPRIKQVVIEGVDSIHLVAPAYKRGIPVATAFTLPVVITTQN